MRVPLKCSPRRPRPILFLLSWLAFPSAAHAADIQLQPAAIPPGEVFVIHVEPAPGERIAQVQATVLDHHPVFFERGKNLEALGALRASTKPGKVTVHVKVTLAEGNTLIETRVLKVLMKSFPTQRIRMSSSKTGLMDRKLLEQERLHLYSHLDHSRPEPLWQGMFLVPATGRNISSFGRRRYVNGKWWGQHSGADIACANGSPVRSDNSGVVVFAERLRMRGNTVVVDHGFNLFTLYNHLSRIDVHVGDAVRKGEPIGRVGATGFVTGPHLHWEIRVGTIPVNPWMWTQKEVKL